MEINDMTNNPLTPSAFDRITDAEKDGSIIWTAKGIAQKISCSEGWVRKVLARLDGSPVQRTKSGRLFVVEDDLMRFFSKHQQQ